MDTVVTLHGHSYELQSFLNPDTWVQFYDEVGGSFEFNLDKTFLASPPIMFCTIFGYVVISYGLNFLLGEKKRGEKVSTSLVAQLWDKFLYYTAVVHNFNMFLISLTCFAFLIYEVYDAIMTSEPGEGMRNVICDPHARFNKGKIFFWVYIYYLSKFVELIDTLLIVLRRSELRFIHTYHHVTTMLIAYAALWYNGTGPWAIIALNTFVHIPMYYYYLLICIGVRDIWWKNYLTDLQLIQFVLDMALFTSYLYWAFTIEPPRECTGSTFGAAAGFFIVFSFFIMFSRLRIANTRKQRKRQQEQKALDAKKAQ